VHIHSLRVAIWALPIMVHTHLTSGLYGQVTEAGSTRTCFQPSKIKQYKFREEMAPIFLEATILSDKFLYHSLLKI
jgi:hypothetical protein